LVLLLLATVFSAAFGGADINRLKQITEKWRTARAAEHPLEIYLRPLVQSDSAFSSDPGPGLGRLSGPMRDAYDALQYLLTPDLQAQFLGLSTDSLRVEWMRRYWRLRDPTPTTPENERLIEHERRVAMAKGDFASKTRPFWDDRGQIVIGFGEPDSVVETLSSVEEGSGFVPAREEWLYFQEKWVVQFERPNPRGPWKLGSSSARLSSRPDIKQRDLYALGIHPHQADDALAKERLGDVIGNEEERTLLAERGGWDGHDPEALQHELRTDLRAKDLLRQKKDAVVRFRDYYEKGGERFGLHGEPKAPLWYVFDVDVFKGAPGRMRVEVHYQFNLQDLTFHWQDSTYAASYRAEGVLLDRSVHEAARDEYLETVRSADFRSTLAAQLIPGQLVFEVPEGRYRLGIRFVDLASRNEGTYLTDVAVPRLDGRVLEISDIEMASKIVYAGDDWRSRFVKNDRLVVPNPIGAYQKGRTLTGYFEIYGLQLDTERSCHYKVTYSIRPRGKEKPQGWLPGDTPIEKPFVESTFTGDGGTSDLVEELRVDIGTLSSDAYDIVLTVRDLVSGHETATRSSFSILD
jgi:GWxTD domain-containing protein